ncbi:MAG: STAS domain-containing protein [Phycisphaeraceae bacterium]|nr:STAS domain-containing protein [Phycisphaeraceae bacterium]
MATEDPMIDEPVIFERGEIVTVHGEIDYAKTPALRQQLLKITRAGSGVLVLDLHDVAYMDSSGLATLVETLQACRKADRALILCCLSEKVNGIFEIARLGSVFTVVKTLEEAKQAG